MSDTDLAAKDLLSRSGRRGSAGWQRPALRLAAGLLGQFQHGRVRVVAPSGAERWFGRASGDLEATLVIRRPRAVYRFVRGGALGFAEAYLDGDVDSPDLEVLLRLFLINYGALAQRWQATAWHRTWRRFVHRLRPNTRQGSRRNIYAHYDLGNAFYGLWLDPSMTYSAALFRDGDDLKAAQLAKYRRLAEQVRLGPDTHVLEIGCGWGGFAEVAARDYGSRVTALTISEEQHALAQRRIADAGLADRVDVRFQDYREISGQYDAVVSIEMFEAVGEAYWPVYFAKLADALKPGGRCALQAITIADAYFDEYRCTVDFIQRYIFPGGMLPSPTALVEGARAAGLTVEDRLEFGDDYARTLAHWAERFNDAWPAIEALGFDERFRRLWSYYLAYCEAGFRVGTIDVEQVTFRHGH